MVVREPFLDMKALVNKEKIITVLLSDNLNNICSSLYVPWTGQPLFINKKMAPWVITLHAEDGDYITVLYVHVLCYSVYHRLMLTIIQYNLII